MPMTSSILDAALAACNAGLAVIPLFGHADPSVPPSVRGKRPRQANWQTRKLDAAAIKAAWERNPDSNMGIITGALSGVVCLDIDARNGGLAWFEANKDRFQTGSLLKEFSGRDDGGFHLWFTMPIPSVAYVPSRKLAKGVDFQADGGRQVVVAPSIHAATGKPYHWELTKMEAADLPLVAPPLPQWLLDLALAGAPEASSQPFNPKEDDPADIEACSQKLAAFPPAIENEGGDLQTFRAACVCRDHGLTKRTALELLLEYNQRCEPPWTEADLKAKITSAYRNGKHEPGEASVAPFRDATPAPAPVDPEAQAAAILSWHDELRWFINKDGEKTSIKPIISNAAMFLRKDPRFVGSFGYNDFAGAIAMLRPIPGMPPAVYPRPLLDPDVAQIRVAIERGEPEASFSKETMWDAIAMLARQRSFHPVREYLAPLAWDGKPRLDTWLTKVWGAEDPQKYGAKTLIAAVARVMRPGCQVDTVLILEGPQGFYKSQGVAALAPGMTAIINGDPHDKDFIMKLRNAWILELGELASMSRAEVNTWKQMVSCQVDRIRDPYARCPEDKPRQCIWIGTTNDEHYLHDATGNRRYWPVKCQRRGDLAWLAANRDQLWAEARTRFDAGEPWWLNTAQEEQQVEDAAQRMAHDPVQEEVERLVDGHAPMTSRMDAATINELWAAMGNPRLPSPAESRAIGRALRKLGWTAKNERHKGAVCLLFRRPTSGT